MASTRWLRRVLVLAALATALLFATPVSLAQQQQIWGGSLDFLSGARMGTNVTPAGDLVLAGSLENWTKFGGNPVLTPNQGWDPYWAATPDILYEDGVYKMWYTGCVSSCDIGYATSLDGTTWTPYGANPVLLANVSSWDTTLLIPRVIHDGSVYRMWYEGDGPLAIRIGYATSADGINWTKYGTWPVFNGTMTWDQGAVATPALLRVGSTFVMYFSGSPGDTSYSMGRATSADGVHWTEYARNPVMVPGGGWEGNRVHPSWFSIGASGYDLYYTGGSAGTPADVGHATSTDGVNWSKDTSNPVLTPGWAGSWDAWSVAHPFLLTVGSQTRMYFTGYDTVGPPPSVLQIGYAIYAPSAEGYAPSGTWVSSVFDSGSANTTWMSLSWSASTPPNTGLGASVAVGDTPVPDMTWTLSSPALNSPVSLVLPKGRYAQVVVVLVTANVSQTPALVSVGVSYETPVSSPPFTTVVPVMSLGTLGLLLIATLGGAGAAVGIVVLVAQVSRSRASPATAAVSMTPAYCPHCGAPAPPGNRYCIRCGSSLQGLGRGPPLF